MLKFRVFESGKPAEDWTVRNGHLIGADNAAMKGEISFREGMILCQKREIGACSLAVQQPVGPCGEMTIQTTLLPSRDEPYILSLEQARHRLMMMYAKLEDWGMFDLPADHPIIKRIEKSKERFIEALCHQQSDPVRSDQAAKDCLVNGIDGSEEMALDHAEMLLSRRKAAGVLPKHPIGVGVGHTQNDEKVKGAILSNFDLLHLPTPWRDLAVAEGEYRFDWLDKWVEWAAKSRMPLVGGPLVSFEQSVLPDWIYIWEHDYETIRDLIYEHTERTVTRYKNQIRAWNVCSGVHVNGQFNFTVEQLMDLTRMSTMLVRKIQPNAKLLIEVRQPFGEYYGRNQRSVPPLMYADLLVQGGIQFDGFIIRAMMGQSTGGQYVRDLMQVSNLLDSFGMYGKPLHVIVGVPSEPVTEYMVGEGGDAPVDPDCGVWRRPWSTTVQARLLSAMFCVALSKPFVETVSWSDLVDGPHIDLPMSGLVGEDHTPKKSFKALIEFRKALQDKGENSIAAMFSGGKG